MIRGDPQRLHGGLAVRLVGVDPGVRHLVLVEELTDLRQVRVVVVAEDADTDEPRSLQQAPPRLERLEQLVAEVGDLLNDPPQLTLTDAVSLRFAFGIGRNDCGAVSQQRDVACELVRAVDDDRLRLSVDSSTMAIPPDSTT